MSHVSGSDYFHCFHEMVFSSMLSIKFQTPSDLAMVWIADESCGSTTFFPCFFHFVFCYNHPLSIRTLYKALFHYFPLPISVSIINLRWFHFFLIKNNLKKNWLLLNEKKMCEVKGTPTLISMLIDWYLHISGIVSQHRTMESFPLYGKWSSSILQLWQSSQRRHQFQYEISQYLGTAKFLWNHHWQNNRTIK